MSRDQLVVVIGAGVAGLAAAIQLRQHGLSATVIDPGVLGGQLVNLGGIDGWPASGVTGPDLAADLVEESLDAGASLHFDVVRQLRQVDDGWEVVGDDTTIACSWVILASGSSPDSTSIEGAGRLEGRGVSHCAGCDGPIFANKKVVLAGGGPWLHAEVHTLGALVGDLVVVASPVEVARFSGPERTSIRTMAGTVVAAHGSERLTHVTVSDGVTSHDIECDGLFIEAERRPNTAMCSSLPLVRDQRGAIVADHEGRSSMDWLLVVGEARAGATRSAVGSAEDGRRAADVVALRVSATGGDRARHS